MSDTQKDGGPVRSGYGYPGLSRRDYFAVRAMQGMANCGAVSTIVKRSVEMADALIAELEKPRE